jgi:predicted enzyme related to lactoylglutathione lyase
MPTPNLTILCVKNPSASSAFYERILDRKPVYAGPTYVAFAFEGGAMLGLWSAESAGTALSGSGSRIEMAFMVKDAAEVDALHARWAADGVAIAEAPAEAVFGRTFVALDPDGHRLRACLRD